jgi:hypothetical protein
VGSNLGHPEATHGPDVSGPLHEQTVAHPETLILAAIQTIDAIF